MESSEELVLLERVFLRIGSADTDEQLQSTLYKFLTPVLLKLASPADGVRKKVMELLVHVNKRLKSRPKILLPVKDLLAQYNDGEVPPFVTNFTILYIKMGFPRMEPSEKAELIPLLIDCMSGRPRTQQDSLIQLIVPALQYVKIPTDVARKQEMFDLKDKPHVTQLLLDYMMDFLLLSYSAGTLQSKSGVQQATSSSSVTPPGLSENAHKKVLGENTFSAEEIEKIKLGIVEFLGEDILPDELIVSHLLVGTADSRHAVATQADMNLKRIAGNQDWNNPIIVRKLYSLFQGTVTLKGQQQSVKPEDKRSPAGVQLRLKIFPQFLKSREAANFFPASVQVIFDCLYGTNTNAKLKNMAVQFVHHLCLHDAKFKPIGAVLLSGMVKLIGETKEDPRLRCLAYVAVGKISKRVPNLVTKDIALLQTFFDAMCKEDAENKLAVQEALSMMSTAFKNIDSSNLSLMEALIMQNIEKSEPQARLMAVQYAVTVFPRDHIPSRYVLLLACGDMKEEIHAEATKALRSTKLQDRNSSITTDDSMDTSEEPLMPSFVDMVNYIHEKASERLKSSQKYVVGNSVLAFNPGTYGEILMYLRMCLAYSAGTTPDLDTIPSMQEQAPSIAFYVRTLIQNQPDDKGPISIYIGIIRQLLSAIGGAPAMYCLLEMVAVARQKLASHFVKHLDWIKNFMFSSREDMREFAAQLFAIIVVCGESDQKRLEVITELTSNLKSQALEGQHGSMLALGYVIGEIYLMRRNNHAQDMETEASGTSGIDKTITEAVKTIAKQLNSTHTMMVCGACSAIGEIGRSGNLLLESESTNKEAITKLSIIDSLIQKVQSTKENGKIREKAAVTLGLLCVGDGSLPYRKKIIESLLDCAQAKQFELHFTVGEGLVYAALGPASTAARDIWTQTESDYKAPSNGSEEVESLATLLLTKYVRHGNHHIRQAACIWLLTCVRQCSQHPFIQKNLKTIQSAFMSLLGENDEITQDMASKGLALVYDKCSKEQKDELVSILVDKLTTGKRSKQEVTEDTKLFDEGTLGKTPDGQNLSTYRELCSIANDLNQPDLIYKFMHLANHNATWNSKKGAAFGFGMIAKQAGEQLAPVLHQIVPKLYRYQFDPNPKIQGAMTSIWMALVTDQKNTVDKFLKEILNDLMLNLTSNQWRVRESSCMAVNDLLRGRNLDEVVHRLSELWEILFRVRDDIKESVRKAADFAVRTMSKVSIKMCDLSNGKVGEEAISAILPTLLKTGLGSQVEEVRTISLTTIVKISKNAGSLLRPHTPLLVVALLESLSTLEPQMLNYLSLHVAGSAATQEKLDNARLAASKTSPMMEVVRMSVQYVDSTVLSELIPRLTELSRSGVGLGTKAGVANFIISLVHQCAHDLTPYAGKLLGALLNGLHDRNITVKKSYASAIGYLVKIAKDSSVEKLIARLKDWYFEKEEESVREACGVTLQAINQRSPDVLKRHAAQALPLAFLAMHQKNNKKENDDSFQSAWEEVWLDATPGSEAGIRLYLTELVAITQLALESQSWHMKAQGAAAMNTIATKLGSNLGPPHLSMLLNALLAGLAGRTWTGKEALLKAVSSVCVSCKEAVAEEKHEPSVNKIVDAVIRECKKENMEYKIEGIRAVGPMLETHGIDRFQDIVDILNPHLKKNDSDKNDDDISQDTKLEFQATSYQCLGEAWPENEQTQVKHQVMFCELLSSNQNKSVWKVEVEILKTLQKFYKRLCLLKDKQSVNSNSNVLTSLIQQCVPQLCTSLGNVKYAAIRTEALALTELLVSKLKVLDSLNVIPEAEKQRLVTSLQQMSSDSQPDLQIKANSVLVALQ